MTRVSRRTALLIVLVLAPLAAVRAEDVLDHLPPNAMGFAVVRNLSATNDKLVRVIKIFEGLSEVTPPAPLTLIKATTGLGDGVNEGGDVLLALLPGGDNAAEPRPMLLLPVSDYAALAASLSGDGSGGIARVTIAGEDVLVARKGEYALVMNVEHRPTMETLLAASPEAPPQLEPLADWLAANDVAVVLLPTGLDMLLQLGQATSAAQAAEMEQQFADPAFAEMLGQFKAFTRMSDKFLGFCEREFAAGAVGLAIDDATNLRLAKRLVLKADGKLAQTAAAAKLAASPLAAYPAEPFVIAGGGPLPPGWADSLVKGSRSLIEEFPEIYGVKDVDEAQWQQLEESWMKVMQFRSLSMCVLVGENEDPLYSNFYMAADVDDSAAYLKSARKSTELWNEFIAKSSSDIKIQYDFADVQVAGKPALLMSTDVAAAAGDENVPMVKPIIEAMVGEDGKMRIFWVAADEDTVISAIANQERVAKTVKFLGSGIAGLDQDPEVQTTTALMNPASQWTAYVSPPGCVAWFSRLLRGALGQLGGAPAIPEYPAGPPVGFSVSLADGRLDGEVVVPVKALEDLAAFIKKCQDL